MAHLLFALVHSTSAFPKVTYLTILTNGLFEDLSERIGYFVMNLFRNQISKLLNAI